MKPTPKAGAPIMPVSTAEFADVESRFASLANEWASDPALRERAAAAPREVLSERGIAVADALGDCEMRIVANTAEIYHLTLPPDPNADLEDEDLRRVAGGSNCAGSVGTISTTSTFISCLGSAATASSASTT